ncbi:MAG: site-specific DNA-methyltransferase [Chloroflexi bacterium]|nr:site-specific DNA-methyltransferase [Chloroflexota bacterium]
MKNTTIDSIPMTTIGSVHIEFADALTRYEHWLAPTVIVSDGPYGLGLFPGDPPTPGGLGDWYAPHIAAWARYSLPETTLWFWCNEVGWAFVHPVLEANGWRYRSFHTWDKGIAHVAGNVNSNTIRRFPVVTEACVQYVKEVELQTGDGKKLPIREWLRWEWQRSGLPLSKTNEACGVKDAATRKYFTRDHLWYFPPPEMMGRLAEYANKHGKSTNHPYFSLDGKKPVTAEQWTRMRAKWNHEHGVTNVWAEPAVRGNERLKENGSKSLHSNQKPLRLIERIILASSDPGDVVWEPFGGLCTAAVASKRTGRRCFSAEINPEYYELAKRRLEQNDFFSMVQA